MATVYIPFTVSVDGDGKSHNRVEQKLKNGLKPQALLRTLHAEK